MDNYLHLANLHLEDELKTAGSLLKDNARALYSNKRYKINNYKELEKSLMDRYKTHPDILRKRFMNLRQRKFVLYLRIRRLN